MIWALLALLGVPLWLCAIAIGDLVFRNRALRSRHGDIQVRVLRTGKTRWTRGHAVWVSNVFAWRGSPAAWTECLEPIVGVSTRAATPAEQDTLHGLGDHPVVATLDTDQGQSLQVAAAAEDRRDLEGPFRSRVPDRDLPEP